MSSEGHACVTYPNGDVYEGGFVGGLRNGQGSYLFAGPYLRLIAFCI